MLFSGGGNTLQIDPGSSLVGNAVSLSGTTNGGDTLDLGSDTQTYRRTGQFNISNVGTNGKYQGFQHLVVSGHHVFWDVTGDNTSGLAWTVENDGALFIGSPSVLGGQNIVLNSGGLATLAPMTLTNGIVCKNFCALDSNGGTLTLDGPISGVSSGHMTFRHITFRGVVSKSQAGGTTILNTPLQVPFAMKIGARDTFVLGAKGSISSPRMVLDNGILDLRKASATVQVSNLIGTGSIELGSNALTLDHGGKFAGSISGKGSVTISGKLPVYLQRTSTYSGTTTIEPGATLGLVSGGVPNSIIDDKGTLDTSNDSAPVQAKALTGSGILKLGRYPLILNDPSAAVFTGTVQGTSAVHVDHGSETLTGKNSFTGGLYIDGGSVFIAHTASLGAAAAPVHLSQEGRLHILQPLTLTRPVDVGSGGGEIDGPALTSVDPKAGSAAVLQGNLTMAGTLKVTGTVMDNGATTTGDGSVLIRNGLLEVGDASHARTVLPVPVTVGVGGVLRGHGTISSNVTNSAGTVYPGGTIGILHVKGNYTQLPGSSLSIEITPNASAPGQGYDQLSVTGTASLAGALAVQVDPGKYALGTSYDIVHATKGVSGRFSSVSYNKAFAYYIQPVVTYRANDVRLNLVPRNNLFSSGKAVGAHLYIEIQAAASTLNALFEGHAGFWSHGLGAVGSDAGASVYDFGGVTGYGTRIGPRMIVGGAVAAGGTRTSVDQGRVSTTDEGVYGYMRYTVGRWQISSAVGIGHSSLWSHRYLAPTAMVARGATEGWSTSGGVDVRYIRHYDNLIVDPFTSLEYVRSSYNGFTDQGGHILDLAYKGQAANLGIVTAGGRVGFKTSFNGISILPWAMLGVTDYIGNRRTSGLETLGGGVYQGAVPTAIAAAGSVDTGIGVRIIGKQHWGASVAYEGQFSNQSTLSSFDVALNYRW